MRPTLAGFALALSNTMVLASDSQAPSRPITKADAVLAVYREDWGLSSAGTPEIILVVWGDGHIVWSDDRLKGGRPYHAGRVDPLKVTALLTRFKSDGLFADKKLSQAQFGPDSEFITLFVKSGKSQVKMQSWHELFEARGTLVVTSSGASVLDGRSRFDVLRKEPADYLFYRFVWGEIRGKLFELIPAEGNPSGGEPRMKAGVLSWEERVPKTLSR